MRKKPQYITIVAPVAHALVLASGTTHVIYALLPVIGEVSRKTGTTKIGKYVLNHSFMLPGLVTMVTSIVMALLLSSVVPH